MERFDRHLGRGKTYEFTTEDGTVDNFEFKPLGALYLSDFMAVMRSTKKTKAGEDMSMEMLDDEGIKHLQTLLTAEVKTAFPEEKDESKLGIFVMQNFGKLVEILFEINDFGSSKDASIKKRLEMMKNETKPSGNP